MSDAILASGLNALEGLIERAGVLYVKTHISQLSVERFAKPIRRGTFRQGGVHLHMTWVMKGS